MSEQDNLTSTLTRELEDRAHTMDGSLLHLTDVKGRARSIRRRRTATAVVAVAAAVAVVIPTVSLAAHTSGKPEPAAPVSTLTPTPSQTADNESHQPAPGVLDASDLPTGAAPAVDFVERGVLHQADGGTSEVGTHNQATHFVVMSDGSRVWQTGDDVGNPYVQVQDAEGTLHPQARSQWGLAVNPSHSIAAWVTPAGQVMIWTAGATEPAAFGDPITADLDMQAADVTGDDCSLVCTVDVNVADANQGWQPWEVSLNGTEPLRDGSYLTIADNSEAGLTIGYSELTDEGSCSRLLGGGEFTGFRTCRHTLDSFSPDGSLILGGPAYRDGIGDGVIAMYDLKGSLLFDRHGTQQAQAFLQGAQWEDDQHVLAPVFQDGRWSIVRFASDGSMEYAVPPVPGKDMNNPYVLPTGGMPPTP